jgi:hypothetical protein
VDKRFAETLPELSELVYDLVNDEQKKRAAVP